MATDEQREQWAAESAAMDAAGALSHADILNALSVEMFPDLAAGGTMTPGRTHIMMREWAKRVESGEIGPVQNGPWPPASSLSRESW